MIDKIASKYLKYYGEKYRKDELYVKELLGKMNLDGSFCDIDYSGKNGSYYNCLLHFDRINEIAFSEKYDDKAISALEFWYKEPRMDQNWWVNEIGIPMHLAISAIILREKLNGELKEKVLNSFNDFIKDEWTGTNRAWFAQNIIVRGIVSKDKTLILRGKKYLEDTIFISDTGKEGIQPDFAFAQHGAQVYNNGYGIPFICDNAIWIDIFSGTEFTFSKEKADILTSLLLDGNGHMCFCDIADFNTVGRDIVRGYGEKEGRAKRLLPAIRILKEVSERKSELEALEKFINGDKSAFDRTKMFTSLNILTRVKNGTYASVRFGSDKVMAGDISEGKIINGEDKLSGFRGCFCSQYMVTGMEYDKLFPLWNWAFLPGVTCPRIELPTERGAFMKSSFAGGVSDGTNGICAIDLNEDFSENGETVVFGGKKACFFIGNDIIHLGCGLYSKTSLNTTLNQCRSAGKFSVDGKKTDSFEGIAKRIFHEKIGYVFAKPQTVVINAEDRENGWGRITALSKDIFVRDKVFTAYIPHKDNKSYEYAVLCGVSEEETEKYIFPDFVNTEKVQAVKKDDLICAVFYEAGSVTVGGTTVSAVKPCFLIIENDRIIKMI